MKNKKVRKSFKKSEVTQLRSAVVSLVNKSNAQVLPERRVSIVAAIEVANRDLKKSTNKTTDVRSFSALRAVSNFILLATLNKETTSALANTDLLPVGHPRSTRQHAMTASAWRKARAQWIAADPHIADEHRALVASAHSYEPGSIERRHAFARISVLSLKSIPLTASVDPYFSDFYSEELVFDDSKDISAITAGILSFVGGNSRAARSLRARLQRRDRYGKFAFMGGGFSFKFRGADGNFGSVTGNTVGNGGEAGNASSIVEVEVLNSTSPDFKTGLIYSVPSTKGEAIGAILPKEVLETLPNRGQVGPDDVYVDSPAGGLTPAYAPSDWTPTNTITDVNGQIIPTEWRSPDGYEVAASPEMVDSLKSGVMPESRSYTLDRGDVKFTKFKDSYSSWKDIQKDVLKDQSSYHSDLKNFTDSAIGELDRVGDRSAAISRRETRGKREGNREPIDGRPEVLLEDPETYAEQINDAIAAGKDISFSYPSDSGAKYDYDGIQVTPQSIESRDGKDILIASNGKEYDISRINEPSRRDQDRAAFLSKAAAEGKKINPVEALEYKVKTKREAGPDIVTIEDTAGNRFTVTDENDNVRDALRTGGTVVERTPGAAGGSQVKTFLKYGPSTGDTVDLPESTDTEDLRAKLREITRSGNNVRFSYKGNDVVAQPSFSTYPSPKTGKRNIEMWNVGLGEERTYAIEDMLPPKVKTPEAAPVVAPEPGRGLAKLDLSPEANVRQQLVDAARDGVDVSFSYGGKNRTVNPKRFYTNKSGDQMMVGIERESGIEKTYNVGKMAPTLEKAQPAPAQAPVPTEAPTPAGAVDLNDMSLDERVAAAEKAIAEGGQLAFDYNEKPRVITPTEITTSKAGNINVKGIDQNGDEKNFTLSKVGKPVDPKLKAAEAELDRIIDSFSPDDVNDLVDANWPEPALAPTPEPDFAGAVLQSINTRGSNAVRRAAYDPQEQKLFLEFMGKNGAPGGVYSYSGVTPEDARDFANSESFGRAVNQLKKNFEVEKIDSFPAPEDVTPGGPSTPSVGPSPDWESDDDEGGILRAEMADYVVSEAGDGKYGVTIFSGTDPDTGSYAREQERPELFDTVEEAKRFAEKLEADALADEAEYDRQMRELELEGEPIEGDDFPEFDEPAFDSVFTTPEGAYKPDIFNFYRPAGRTVEESADYTDDPAVLSTKFPVDELKTALETAILPRGGNRATGFAPLPFESGDEMVPAEALAEALELMGIPTGEAVANAYDSILSLPEGQRNIDRVRIELGRPEGTLSDRFTDGIIPTAGDPSAPPVDPTLLSPTGRRVTQLDQYGDISGWEQIGPQGGTNEGGVFESPDGSQYYIKRAQSRSHADNEALASAIYRELGINATNVGFGQMDGSTWVVSPMVQGAREDLVERMRNNDTAYIAAIKDGFAVDVMLSNYDVTGLVFDNIVSNADGEPVRIDAGGSLMYRARGSLKSWFGDEPDEIDTMRDPDLSESGTPQRIASILFGSMTDAEVAESAKRLLDISPSRIDELVDMIVESEADKELLKSRIKTRRQRILERFGLDDQQDTDILGEPTSLAQAIGYPAQDLQPNDVTLTDSFTIERVFRDDDTPAGKVSVQGYYPGHESQRKEWNENTQIESVRGGLVPPKGDKPALHRPRAPRRPGGGAFTGRVLELLRGITSYEEILERLKDIPIIVFDFETTGLMDKARPEIIERNMPVQIGAVKVVNGVVVDRFSRYMNPNFRLSNWSRDNLKREDGSPLTDEFLREQPSIEDVHREFAEWVGAPGAIFAGHYISGFDLPILRRALKDAGVDLNIDGTIDTLDVARAILPKWSVKSPDGPMMVNEAGRRVSSYKLGAVADYLGVSKADWHRADADAEMAANILKEMLDRAIDDPDTPKTLLDVDGSYDQALEAEKAFEAEVEKYKEDLAAYEIAKAIAAAWNCKDSNGNPITSAAALIAAAGDDKTPCNIPSVDELIERSTPQDSEFVDPEQVPIGSTSDDNSYVNTTGDRPEYDGVDSRPRFAGMLPGESYPPSPQQLAGIEAFFTGGDIAMIAAAGAGKTSFLIALTRRIQKYAPERRGVYIAFNRSVADEGRKKMAALTNIEVRTADSISYNWTKVNLPELIKKQDSKTAIYKPQEVIKHLGLPKTIPTINRAGEPDTLDGADLVRVFRKAIQRYSISSDTEIGPQHFVDSEIDVTPAILDGARRWWEDILDPAGRMPFTFAHMKKLWALSNPDLTKQGSGLSDGVDFIFMDEAQDTNPVLGSVISAQTAQVVYVGDPNQAIYQFMGAEDWLQRVKTDHTLPLTVSYRFGSNIADIANEFLKFKKNNYPVDPSMIFDVEGAGKVPGRIVDPGSMENADVVIVRSNAGAFKEIRAELERGRKVGVTKSFKNDLTDFIDGLEWLQRPPATRGKRPSNMPDELREFDTFDELTKAATDENNKDLSTKAKLIVSDAQDLGIDGMRELNDRLIVIAGAGGGGGSGELTYEVGDSGELAAGVTYTVTPSEIVLGGKTFDNKTAIARSGGGQATFDRARKAWVIKAGTDEQRMSALDALNLALGGGSENRPDVIVTTGHQAKGLEYDRVRVGRDFRGPTPLKDKATGEIVGWDMPKVEEVNLAYVVVTRAMKELDPGSLRWVFDLPPELMGTEEVPTGEAIPMPPVSEAIPLPPVPEAAPTVEEVSIPDVPPDVPEEPVSAPAVMPGKEPERGEAETPVSTASPDVAPNVAETQEAAEEDSKFSFAMQQLPPGTIAPEAQKTIDEFNEFGEKLTGRDSKQRPGDKKKITEVLDQVNSAIEAYKRGEMTMEKLLDEFESAAKKFPPSAKTDDETLDREVLTDYISEIARDILNSTAGRPVAPGLPAPDSKGAGGRPLGYSKDGVFIVPGMRVRDKWGYAGTVDTYNQGDYINVYIRLDIDPRDPDKVKKGRWGAGVARVSKNPSQLTVIKPGDDDSPWIDNGRTKDDKKPKRLEEQLAEWSTIKTDRDAVLAEKKALLEDALERVAAEGLGSEQDRIEAAIAKIDKEMAAIDDSIVNRFGTVSPSITDLTRDEARAYDNMKTQRRRLATERAKEVVKLKTLRGGEPEAGTTEALRENVEERAREAEAEADKFKLSDEEAGAIRSRLDELDEIIDNIDTELDKYDASKKMKPEVERAYDKLRADDNKARNERDDLLRKLAYSGLTR